MMVSNKVGCHNQSQMVPLQSGEFSQIATYLCLNVTVETELVFCTVFSFPQLLLECRPCEMAIETKRLCLCSCNVLFTRHQMFLQPTSTTSEPRVSLSSQFSIFAFGKGRHFLFYGSSTHFPGGAGLRGLMVSSSFAVGNQTHHQIGSSDSYGEYGVDQGELSLRKLFAMENQGKSNQRKRS